MPHCRWSQIQHALFGTSSCRHPLAQDPAVLQQHELHCRKGQPWIAHTVAEDKEDPQPSIQDRSDPHWRKLHRIKNPRAEEEGQEPHQKGPWTKTSGEGKDLHRHMIETGIAPWHRIAHRRRRRRRAAEDEEDPHSSTQDQEGRHQRKPHRRKPHRPQNPCTGAEGRASHQLGPWIKTEEGGDLHRPKIETKTVPQHRIAHKEGRDLHQPRTETRQDPQHRITDKAHGDLHRPKISINQASCDEGGVTNCAAPKQQIYTEEDRYRRDNTTLHRICTEARDLHNIIAKLHRKDTKEGAQRRVHRRRAVLHRVKGKTRDLHRNYGSKLRQWHYNLLLTATSRRGAGTEGRRDLHRSAHGTLSPKPAVEVHGESNQLADTGRMTTQKASHRRSMGAENGSLAPISLARIFGEDEDIMEIDSPA